ncbi:MAG: hypothetical protein WD431_25545 [Cyclobacteriaceae bacterium]
MQPGDTLELELHSALINKGFVNSGYSREIVYNGTFIGQSMPSIGYNSGVELNSDEKRKKYELTEKIDELPPHDDPFGMRTMLFNDDADLINFEATIGTSLDQIAVAPGYLQKEWTEGDRRYFYYVQDSKIDLFLLSRNGEFVRVYWIILIICRPVCREHCKQPRRTLPMRKKTGCIVWLMKKLLQSLKL